jgi:hypothetical protein
MSNGSVLGKKNSLFAPIRFPAPFPVSASKFPVRAGREVFAGNN